MSGNGDKLGGRYVQGVDKEELDETTTEGKENEYRKYWTADVADRCGYGR